MSARPREILGGDATSESGGAVTAPLEPELPFPGATGRGVKIAVVDSGVHVNHPHITAPIQPVFLDSSELDRSIDDNAGHGTAVTAAIQEKAPEAEYFAIKLFGRS